ncbi:MAG TPA: LysR substrate-binding domain-containing protein [Accumulibacter sp.]|jgi:DNA-binding transcriptional LysR family regulator|nr:LysR substrate-binding domain-containing protein [Accumulibacter sp.]HNK04817.1 LysR substrate-binding domain-containing protein [Accumulibacter sp.]HNN33741.1 LysR substrate-binding domain-containing protein [Ottowia sp.]
MELRHLRYFLAVAEELHFARAAERLHIEQSPLSRAIKELEVELGAQLFVRTSRSTRLTLAGKLLMESAPRVFLALEQARESAKAGANGFHGQLRIALSDGITPSRLPALLARCREEDPETEVRLFEVPLAQQLNGLRDDLYDAGFSMADEVGDGIIVEPAWEDELMVAVPARHPLLAYKRVPPEEVLRHPLVLGDPAICEGHARQIDRILRKQDREPLIVQYVATFDVMMTFVSAGLALGLAGAAHIGSSREPGVLGRPLAGKPPLLTTYLLRRDADPSQPLARFIERVEALGPELPGR